MDFLYNIDKNILLFIQEHIRKDFITPIAKFITYLGNSGLIWIIICLALLCFRKTRSAGACVALAIILDYLICNLLLKNTIARTRPYEAVEGLQRIIEKQKDFSFPSGHAGVSFAAAVVMLKMLPKRLGIPAISLASLIALSRLYVGVHYPSDVLGGAAVGTVCAIITCITYRHLFLKKNKN